MIHYTDTTVFNVNAQVIVNTVNCVGVMGNGLALECRLRYPVMFMEYVERCRRGEMRIGEPYLCWHSTQLGILNFPCKDHWKLPSRVEWIRRGLMGFRALLTATPLHSIAFPPLGCDLGRLRWTDIQPLMEEMLADAPCEVFICMDREAAATGIDGRMTALLNDVEHPGWLAGVNLQPHLRACLHAALPITHFRHLRRAAGIGMITYERVHGYLYALATGFADL